MINKNFTQYDLPCEGCSNEPLDKIPLARVIETLDRDYAKNDLESAKRHITYWRREAEKLGDLRSELSLCNEEIGLCRRTNDKDAALASIDRACILIERVGMEQARSAGTVMVNIATTCLHFKDNEKALAFYGKAEAIFKDSLPAISYEYAALYNNQAAAYEALSYYEKAESLLKKALSILDGCPSHRIDMAISYANLARVTWAFKKNEAYSLAYLSQSWEVLTDETVTHDGLYAFVCSKCAEVFALFGKEEEAIALYEVAREIYEGS